MKSIFFFLFSAFIFVVNSCAVRKVEVITDTDTSLNLSKQGLTEIPSEVFDNKQLKVLKLFGNNLDTLSGRIAELENLEELYIGNNHLTSLPPEIGKLKKLKILSVQYNDLISLPPEIGKMESLEQLWLNQNELQTFPAEIGELKKLVTLQAEYNFLTIIPSEIGNCEALKFIYLRRNNLISLPEEFGNLHNLKEIYLAGAGILVDVPESFCSMRYLEILEIDNTTAIPSCLYVYVANRLKIIQK